MSNKPEPTAEENAAAERRIQELDRLAPACAWEKGYYRCTFEQRRAREQWATIMAEQQVYEEAYC